MLGRIADFDDARGDGTFVADDGESYYFHCVAIADGSRSISVGVRASAQRRTGLLGRDEAVDVVALS